MRRAKWRLALKLGPELEVSRDAVELALECARVGPRGVEMHVALGALHLCLQLLRTARTSPMTKT